MELLEILKNKEKVLNIAGIEKEIKCPTTTLNRYLKTGYIPKVWKEALRQWAEKTLKV